MFAGIDFVGLLSLGLTGITIGVVTGLVMLVIVRVLESRYHLFA